MEHKIVTEHFASPGAFVTALSRGAEHCPIPPMSDAADSNDFRHSKNMKEVIRLADTGWAEGTTKAMTYRTRLDARLESTGKQVQWRHQIEALDMLDIGRYLDGEPECWIAPMQEEIKGKFIHIVFNGAVSCGVDINVIISKGAVVSALVEQLELQGYRVKVTLVMSLKGHDDKIGAKAIVKIDVKQYEQPLEMDALTFWLAHPSVLRRLMFKWVETNPKENTAELGYSYGQPCDIADSEHGDLYIRAGHYSDVTWHQLDSAVAWIQGQIKKVLSREGEK